MSTSPRALADPRFLALRGLTVRAKGTGHSGESTKETFESTGTHSLNPHLVLEKLRRRNGTSRVQMVVLEPRLLS